MKCFAYVRVSTLKQADGASLEAQRFSIERYAKQNDLEVTRWFTETKTAASRGKRPEFNHLIRLLKQGKAEGVIIHKIDRSARNLRDWADFVALSEQRGIAIHIAAESLDLSSRGGRLTADIQAVVASDYIRNLRAEALKGIDARYKQGLLPSRAPIGYLDNGPGEVKTIDPVQAPLVKELFRLYATGAYSLRSVREEINERGLRNKKGNPLSVNSICKILHNRFYIGQLLVKRTGEIYEGIHEPLIKKTLFDACQDLLAGRKRRKTNTRHNFAYSRMLDCALCQKKIIAERQRGHVYYRCHTKGCPLKCTREQEIEKRIARSLQSLEIDNQHASHIREELHQLVKARSAHFENLVQSYQLRLDQVNTRIDRLTDLLLDGAIERDTYNTKRRALLDEKLDLEEKLAQIERVDSNIMETVEHYLELAKTAQLSFKTGSTSKKLRMLRSLTSNLHVSPEYVSIEPRRPYSVLLKLKSVLDCGEQRDVPRTESHESDNLTSLASQLIEWAIGEDEERGDNLP